MFGGKDESGSEGSICDCGRVVEEVSQQSVVEGYYGHEGQGWDWEHGEVGGSVGGVGGIEEIEE